jgi:archaellum biogenesis ATPase FlaH
MLICRKKIKHELKNKVICEILNTILMLNANVRIIDDLKTFFTNSKEKSLQKNET